jgi:hypothetical protein
MKRILRREIYIETEQLACVRIEAKEKYPTCEICDEKPNMFPPAMIAEILRISSREIYQRIEANEVHIFEDASFQLFVCSASLAEALKKREKLLH